MSFLSDKDAAAQEDGSDATAFLRSATFSSPSTSSAPANPDAAPTAYSTGASEPTTAADLLNAAAFDPARLHPLANLGDKLDYLLLEDDKLNSTLGGDTAVPSRGWSDDLCYGTGTTYLSGE